MFTWENAVAFFSHPSRRQKNEQHNVHIPTDYSLLEQLVLDGASEVQDFETFFSFLLI